MYICVSKMFFTFPPTDRLRRIYGRYVRRQTKLGRWHPDLRGSSAHPVCSDPVHKTHQPVSDCLAIQDSARGNSRVPESRETTASPTTPDTIRPAHADTPRTGPEAADADAGDRIPDSSAPVSGAVDDYLELCEAEDRKPDVPLKGSFNVRPGRDLHRRAEHRRAVERDEETFDFVDRFCKGSARDCQKTGKLRTHVRCCERQLPIDAGRSPYRNNANVQEMFSPFRCRVRPCAAEPHKAI